MDEIVNPHDKLFRETWSDLASAKSFLRHYLPPEVLAVTALDTLEICKDSFIEKDLAWAAGDATRHAGGKTGGVATGVD